MYRKKLLAAVLLSFSLSPSFALAESNQAPLTDVSLEEVVVTATRTPIEKKTANANITIITSEQIQQNHYRDAMDVLRDVPGLSISQYTTAGYNHMNGLYLNGSEDVVVLVDGVKQDFPGGNAALLTFSLKNLDHIDRIEVLRGSSSTLYGSNAKGGVIHIITKKIALKDHTKTKLGFSYGSFQKKYSIANEGRTGSLDWRISYQKDNGKDYKDGRGDEYFSDLDADTFQAHLGYDFNSKSHLALNYQNYRDDNKYRLRPHILEHKGVQESSYKLSEWNAIWEHQIDTHTKNQFSIARNNYNAVYPSGGAVNVRSLKVSEQFDKTLGNHLLTFGFAFIQDKTLGAKITTNTLTSRSFYLQDQWKITAPLKLTAGIRHDNTSAFGTHSSPSVALGYDISPVTHAYISYNEYFITPLPKQLYTPVSGNPNLKPESGATKEIGIQHDFGKDLTGSAHIFERNSRDRIGYISKHYLNVGDEKAHGWDIQFSKRFNQHFKTNLSYTHLRVDPTFGREANVDGYLPKDEWKIGMDYRNRTLSAGLSARGCLEQLGPQTSDVLGDFYPATTYWVFDLALNYQLTPDAKIYFKVNNLFDKFYAERSSSRNKYYYSKVVEAWYTSPGRNFMLGVDYSF